MPIKRLAYIDWMRGLACVLMIQAHCYDSWLNPEARKTLLYRWSQELSTLPAPIFLFLSGVSFALVTEGLRQKNKPGSQIFKTALLRGAEILGLGFLLRVQEFVLGYPKSPWTDLLKVDVLNILGVSIIFMALFWRLVSMGGLPPASTSDVSNALQTVKSARRWRKRAIGLSLLIAAVIAIATPPLWTTHRPNFLPWMLESYINGVHNFGSPTPWIFSIFPWCGFAFVGLAFGSFLFSDFAQRKEVSALGIVGAIGALACALSLWWDYSSVKFYAVYDYWHSSPNFFLMRCGVLLLLTLAICAWCRWGWVTEGFSPFIQFGKTSLLVYWVHIEFVYGRLSILPKFRSAIPLATAGMVVIFAAMLGISIWRTRAKKRAGNPLQSTTSQSLSEAM
ncbi:MAG TPA: acyltransferase family protein [Candidatus Dormibacteraeota bacterium]|nr:acyltransferase family protein [Candidatus Dormibacteraeota bacterium]